MSSGFVPSGGGFVPGTNSGSGSGGGGGGGGADQGIEYLRPSVGGTLQISNTLRTTVIDCGSEGLGADLALAIDPPVDGFIKLIIVAPPSNTGTITFAPGSVPGNWQLLGSQNGALQLVWSATAGVWFLAAAPLNWSEADGVVDGTQVHVDGVTIIGLGTRQSPLRLF